MNIQERVQEVFNRFNVNLTVSKKTELAEAILDNGTVIYTDAEEFAEGVEAYIINDEGERITLPPGDYTLQDGSVLTIGEGGVVTSVSPYVQPDASTAPAAEAAAPPPPPTKEPIKKKKEFADDEEKQDEEQQMEGTPITREEVAVMIAEAIAALQDTEPEEVAEAVVEEENIVAELKSLKAELSKLNKQAASSGLSRVARVSKPEPVNLKNLSTSERVSALLNQFSK